MKRHFLAWIGCAVFATATLASQTVETLTPSPFAGSGGVTVNPLGEIFVGDFGQLLNNANGTQVHKILPDGTLQVFAGGLMGASGNDLDSQGNLFQANIAGNTVSKITPDGNVSTFATGLAAPVGVVVNPDNSLFVANCGGGSIARVTPQGATSIFVSSGLLSCPNGLTRDEEGNIYTSNFNNGSVVKIAPDGSPSVLATIPGNGNGHLSFANGVLYVIGRNANQIFEVTLDGTVTKIAGAGPDGAGSRGNADGPALEATFSIPNGIHASPDGDTLYVSSGVGTVGPALNPVVIRAIRGIRGLDRKTEIPQFGNGGGIRSDLVIYNPSASETASGDVAFFDGDGNPLAPLNLLAAPALLLRAPSGTRFDLPPLGTITFSTNGEGPLVAGSALIKSTAEVSGVVRFEITGVGIAGVGAAPPATSAIAPARRQGDLRTGLAIRNVGDEAVSVELTLKDAQGIVVAGGTNQMQIAGQGRVAAFIEELFADADTTTFNGTICARSTGGSISVIALELGENPGEFTTLPVSVIRE